MPFFTPTAPLDVKIDVAWAAESTAFKPRVETRRLRLQRRAETTLAQLISLLGDCLFETAAPSAHHGPDVARLAPRLTYTDADGDTIVISSDRELAAALEANTTLEYLGISGNEIESKELRKKLREALTSKAA